MGNGENGGYNVCCFGDNNVECKVKFKFTSVIYFCV
jgi:hypothetical protein